MPFLSLERLMEIQTLKVNEINPAKYNPRKDLQPGDPEYEKLKKSIIEFDMVEPLVWNKRTDNLVGGHQRLKILKELGIENVEVSVVDLSEVKEKALNLALNKISGEWDMPRLKDILEELDTGEFDIEITGFDFKEIEDLMTQFHVPEKGLIEDDAVPETTESISRRGDLWSLGNHRLLCGDATLRADVEKLMGGEKADMVFTDPPYGIDLDTDWRGITGSKKSQLLGKRVKGRKYRPVIGDDKPYDPSLLLELFVDVGEIFLWGAEYYHHQLPDEGTFLVWDKSSDDADKMIGSAFEICWSKRKHKKEVARIYARGTYGAHPKDDGIRKHPTQKPVRLALWFFERWAKKCEIIADLYGGSGSTLIACEKLGRRCYMMEIDEHYCDVIIKRWEDFTDKQAVRIDG